ncbi:MAG TPA: MCE family protein [Nocardioides sp.]|nr:MCE family protein [Nocardioides sp.]
MSLPSVQPPTRSRIPSSAYKVAVFAVTTTILIGLLATLIGNISFADSRSYYGLFRDATGVFVGDRVRVSGVEVGSVRQIELVDAGGGHRLARVRFEVQKGVPVFAGAELHLRYENIVGQRYLAIVESAGGGERMAEGKTFPISQTVPALNLTQLFNGFQPLFRALDPQQVNTFANELVQALQGESGSIAALAHDTAQLTNTLADKDQVIGSLVRNLGTVLRTVGDRDEQLADLIVKFRDLMNGLASDKDTISASLPQLADLLGSSTSMIRAVRPPLKQDLAALQTLTGQVHATRDDLDDSLKFLPRKLRVLTRTGSYGSWFNFFVCGMEVRLRLAGGTVKLAGPGLASNERDTVCAGGMQ